MYHVVIALLAVVGCAAIPPPALPTVMPAPPENTGDSLIGTQWQLVSYGMTGAPTPVGAEVTITLYFNADGDTGGLGGCNRYGARYQVQDNTLSFSRIVRTQIACADEQVMQLEQQYLAALPEAGRFELSADQLAIWYDDGSSVLNFVPLVATTPTPNATS